MKNLTNIILLFNLFFMAQTTNAMNFSQRFFSTVQDCAAGQGCPLHIELYEEQLDLALNKSDEEHLREQHGWNVFQRRICDIASCGTKAIAAATVSSYLMSNPNFLMFTGMIGMGFRDKIEQAINSFNTALWPDEISLKLDELDLKVMLAEKYIPKSRHEFILDTLQEIRRALSFTPNDKQYLVKKVKHVETLLKLPLNKPSSTPLTTEEKGIVLQSISKNMTTYDPRLVDSLQDMAFDFMNDSTDPEAITKSSYFFLGVPGTGKTTTANLIATEVKRYFCPINLSKIEPNELLDGREAPGGSDQIRMGKIAECFLNAGTLEVIFFLDEVHDVLNPANKKSAQWQSILKRLTDEDAAFITDDGLRTDLDIRKSKFVFAANRPSDDTEGALADRLAGVFQFPPADLDARQTIAKEHFYRWNKEYSKKTVGDISHNKIFKDIIAFDADYCKENGVRGLKKVVKRFASYLGLKETKARKDSGFDVAEKFREAQGIRLDDWKNR